MIEEPPYDDKCYVSIFHVLLLWGTDGPDAVWEELLEAFTEFHAAQMELDDD